ncbi:MAG: hypothetical protein IPJ43_05775 [Saprospiraceae bacterium]|nr:hypothetical protein [Saprospiraceae bacterium]
MNNVGLDADAQYAHGAAWCDFDLDGYADLIVTNFLKHAFINFIEIMAMAVLLR